MVQKSDKKSLSSQYAVELRAVTNTMIMKYEVQQGAKKKQTVQVVVDFHALMLPENMAPLTQPVLLLRPAAIPNMVTSAPPLKKNKSSSASASSHADEVLATAMATWKKTAKHLYS
jgi:hypothetical protein